jgi:hypothetical protein
MRSRLALHLRRALALGAVVTLVSVVAAQGACVLAQSSGDVPQLPLTRPTIVHPSVVPTTTAILTRWPEEFVVPVELADPKSVVYARAFIDYDPLNGTLQANDDQPFQYDPATQTTRVRVLRINVPEPTELGRCHTIEIVVALQFQPSEPKNAHTPVEPPGGDSVTWTYNPSGDVNGCPTVDAGLEAGLVDGGEGGLR